MIYCDRHIEKAIRDGRFIVEPRPHPRQYDPTSLNLRAGDDFYVWKSSLRAKGTSHTINLDEIDLPDLIEFTDRLQPNADGIVVIPPGAFVLVRTFEHIRLPQPSRLAARVEGRSKQARLGMAVHITAPIIHAGFAGKITLEILNHGPFQLELRPNHTMICQIVIEEVSGIAKREGSTAFSRQSTPLGTPRSR